MATAALILGGLLALLAGLLAVPLTVAFSIRRIGETSGFVRFRWLFGLVRFQVDIPSDGASPTEPSPRPNARPRREKKKGRGGARPLALIRNAAFRRRAYRFLRDMLQATHPRDLFLRLRVGLGDPADTGMLWAALGPLAGMARNLRNVDLRIEPEFVEPVVEVESRGQFRLVPIRFIALTAAFVLSPAVLQAWRRSRRKEG